MADIKFRRLLIIIIVSFIRKDIIIDKIYLHTIARLMIIFLRHSEMRELNANFKGIASAVGFTSFYKVVQDIILI